MPPPPGPQTKQTPPFRLLSPAGTALSAARPAIANQRHGNRAEGSAGPHSADLTRFVIPVRPDPNDDIAF